jgi:hypothetical protein
MQAIHASTTSRRALLGAVSALPLAAVPMVARAGSADAELIRLCAAFDACEMRLSAIFNPVPGGYDEETANAEAKPNYERMSALLDHLEAAHATTPEGILARARPLGVHAGEGAYCLDIGPTWAGRLVAVLLRDALGLSGMPIPAALLNAGAEEALPAAITSAAASPHPDAELIRVCAEHLVNWDAYNAYDGNLEPRDNPLWHAYERTFDAIESAEPQTIDGIIAKARAAKAEAQQPDGDEDPGFGEGAEWAWDLVNDLLRINGTVA